MKGLARLELRYGRYAIKNLTLYIAAVNLAVFLLSIFPQAPNVIFLLGLDPARIINKLELWRIVTFVFIPETFSIIWILFSVYFIYMVGAALEQYWGKFRLNVYYFTGMLGSIIASFIVYIFAGGGMMTGYYLNMSLFLAYATLFPEQEFLIFFVLPVKAKYLGALDALFLIVMMISSLQIGAWYNAIAIIVAMINYLIFFGGDFINWIKLKRQVSENRRRFFDQVRPYKDNRKY
ncbi:MAG TPA: hypothetical protein GX501_09770 [Clostridiaceae bacterium]|nr:hypothetical protein [Clostridiaceae bacterium]